MTASMPPHDEMSLAPEAGAPGIRIRTAPPVHRPRKTGTGFLIWVAALLAGIGLGFGLHRAVPAVSERFDDWMTQLRR